jgi:hypothetical protein
LLVADVEFVGASGLPGSPEAPYIVSKLRPDLNSQKVKTKPQENTSDPAWREKKSFALGSPDGHGLVVLIYSRDASGDDQRISSTTVPLNDFSIGETEERAFALTPAKEFNWGGTLTLSVTITCKNPGVAKGPIPPGSEAIGVEATSDDAECQFSWGNLSSSYSTSFTGYTSYSESLSEIHEGEAGLHVHPAPTRPPPATAHVGLLSLSGKVVGARGIPQCETYVVAAICRKGGKVLAKVVSDPVGETTDPEWGLPFDFGKVRKGYSVEITVFRKTDATEGEVIGHALKEVKEIEAGLEDQVDLPITKELLWEKEEPTDGVLSVQFNLSVIDESKAAVDAAPAGAAQE